MISCSNTECNIIRDEMVLKHFSKEETREFSGAIKHFEDYLQTHDRCQAYYMIGCYQNYVRHLRTYEFHRSEPLSIQIPKAYHLAAFNALSLELKREIWWDADLKRALIKNDKIQELNFDQSKRYWKFLKEWSQTNDYVSNYVDKYSSVGDFSASFVAGGIVEQACYDFSDPKMRLLLTIHYLSINQYQAE